MSSYIIEALELAWSEIRKNHPDVPGVIIVTGRRRHKAEATTLGQHCPDVWRISHEGQASEVVIFGERLADGGTAVLNTLIHEAVHAMCKARGVKDTSNRNRYHNKVFARTAEELGLQPPDVSGGPHFGYSDCKITDETREKYKLAIDKINAACKTYVAPKLDKEEVKVKRQPRRAQCECPEGQNEIPWSKKLAEKAMLANGIICGACRRPFEEIEE